MGIDRRVQRTRTALYDALVALIRERPYDQIRVDDILERANVGRSTYYAHFRSKDDLLRRSVERLEVELTEAARDARGPDAVWQVSRVLFDHVDRHRDIPAALSGDGAAEIVLQAVADAYSRVLRRLPAPGGALPDELRIGFLAATFRLVLGWWLRRPGRTDRDQAFNWFVALASGGLGLRPRAAGGRPGDTSAGRP